MDAPPGFKPISAPNFINRTEPSISELVSELRDTFRESDFDRVEETLVAREAKLKAEIEAKEREIGLLKESLGFEKLEKMNIELELKKVMGERCGNGVCFDGRVVKGELESERSELGVVKNRGIGNGDASAGVELGGCGTVGVLGEKKRFVAESGQRLGKGTGIDIGDGGEDICYSQATLNGKERQSVIADTERQSSSGAVQKNLATGLAKSIGITPGSDNNRVEETLAREAMLKAEIREKIGLFQQKNQPKRFERHSYEIKLKTVEGERCGEELVKKVRENGYGSCLDDGKVMKNGLRHGSCELEMLKNRGVGGGNASAVAEMEGKKVEILDEKKRMVGEPSKKDGPGASGGRMGIRTLINIEDSDEDEGNSHRKETTSCVVLDNERKISSGAVQRNLAARRVEPIGNLKRGIVSSRQTGTKIKNILANCHVSACSSSSSSSSSSGEFPNFLELRTSNKKMRS